MQRFGSSGLFFCCSGGLRGASDRKNTTNAGSRSGKLAIDHTRVLARGEGFIAIQNSLGLSTDLHQYGVSHGTPPDTIAQELIEVAREEVGPMALIQVAPEQGAFMTLFAQLIGVRNAVGVGIFTASLALCIARGLPEDG